MTFEDYKKTQKIINRELKSYLKGTVVWHSKVAGTYIKERQV